MNRDMRNHAADRAVRAGLVGSQAFAEGRKKAQQLSG